MSYNKNNKPSGVITKKHSTSTVSSTSNIQPPTPKTKTTTTSTPTTPTTKPTTKPAPTTPPPNTTITATTNEQQQTNPLTKPKSNILIKSVNSTKTKQYQQQQQKQQQKQQQQQESTPDIELPIKSKMKTIDVDIKRMLLKLDLLDYRSILESENIVSIDQFLLITDEHLRLMNFKIGDIINLKKAIKDYKVGGVINNYNNINNNTNNNNINSNIDKYNSGNNQAKFIEDFLTSEAFQKAIKSAFSISSNNKDFGESLVSNIVQQTKQQDNKEEEPEEELIEEVIEEDEAEEQEEAKQTDNQVMDDGQDFSNAFNNQEEKEEQEEEQEEIEHIKFNSSDEESDTEITPPSPPQNEKQKETEIEDDKKMEDKDKKVILPSQSSSDEEDKKSKLKKDSTRKSRSRSRSASRSPSRSRSTGSTSSRSRSISISGSNRSSYSSGSSSSSRSRSRSRSLSRSRSRSLSESKKKDNKKKKSKRKSKSKKKKDTTKISDDEEMKDSSDVEKKKQYKRSEEQKQKENQRKKEQRRKEEEEDKKYHEEHKGSGGFTFPTTTTTTTSSPTLSSTSIDKDRISSLEAIENYIEERRQEWLENNIEKLKKMAEPYWRSSQNNIEILKRHEKSCVEINTTKCRIFNKFQYEFSPSVYKLISHTFEDFWREKWIVDMLQSPTPPPPYIEPSINKNKQSSTKSTQRNVVHVSEDKDNYNESGVENWNEPDLIDHNAKNDTDDESEKEKEKEKEIEKEKPTTSINKKLELNDDIWSPSTNKKRKKITPPTSPPKPSTSPPPQPPLDNDDDYVMNFNDGDEDYADVEKESDDDEKDHKKSKKNKKSLESEKEEQVEEEEEEEEIVIRGKHGKDLEAVLSGESSKSKPKSINKKKTIQPLSSQEGSSDDDIIIEKTVNKKKYDSDIEMKPSSEESDIDPKRGGGKKTSYSSSSISSNNKRKTSRKGGNKGNKVIKSDESQSESDEDDLQATDIEFINDSEGSDVFEDDDDYSNESEEYDDSEEEQTSGIIEISDGEGGTIDFDKEEPVVRRKPQITSTRKKRRAKIIDIKDINNVNKYTLRVRKEEEEENKQLEEIRATRSKEGMKRDSLFIFPGGKSSSSSQSSNINEEDDILLDPKIGCFLKPHQLKGVQFLWENMVFKGKGCILAHSMGLGKSLQCVTFLHTHNRYHRGSKYLLIVPANTLYNWEKEFKKWLPKGEREPLRVFAPGNQDLAKRFPTFNDWYANGGVLALTFESFANTVNKHIKEPSIAKILEADFMIVDEGHRLKSNKTKMSDAASLIKTQRKVLLTGYPLQNNLLEYYTMIDYIRNLHLGTEKEFRERFIKPITAGTKGDASERDIRLMRSRLAALQSLIKDFVQRLGPEVLDREMEVSKSEKMILVKRTDIQSKLLEISIKNSTVNDHFAQYEVLTVVCNHPDGLLEKKPLVTKDLEKKSISELKSILAANDVPTLDIIYKSELIQRVIQLNEIKASDLLQPSVFSSYFNQIGYRRGILERSNKFVLFFSMLKHFNDNNEKVVAFSFSISTLNQLEYFIQKKLGWKNGVEYLRLDGTTPSKTRQRLIDLYNEEGNQVKLFIISTKAGSLGTNLTGGTRVIIMDLSWNPVHDRQAVFRCYRMGQKKQVHVYTLVMAGTAEQKTYTQMIYKQALAKRAVDSETPKNVEDQVKIRNRELVDVPQDVESIKNELEKGSDPVFNKVIKENQSAIIAIKDVYDYFTVDEYGKLTEEEEKQAIDEYEKELLNPNSNQNNNPSSGLLNFQKPPSLLRPNQNSHF